MVIWDKIILRGDNALLNYHSMNTKYYFFDDGLGLKWVYQTTLLWMPCHSQTCEWHVHGHWFFFSRLFFFFFRGNKNVSLYLSWNVIPNAGVLPLISQPNKFYFDFPNEYTVNRGGFDHWCCYQSQSLENVHL